MDSERKLNPTKQKNLFNWIFERDTDNSQDQGKPNRPNTFLPDQVKPKLAFGFGYNPDLLKRGIIKYSYSHDLENGLKLYEFEPRLSYRIFTVLAKILKYRCVESELRDKNTVIKNKYFITDKNPKKIVEKINYAILEIFENYDPTS